MAMPLSEMISFFEEQAKRARLGMSVARSSANYRLAVLNCRQAFKSRLMQGLIRWRTGIDPSSSLSEAVQGFAGDWEAIQSIAGNAAKLSDTPAERVAILAYLIGQPIPVDIGSEGLESDRLLDFVLGGWLFGAWNDRLWEHGIEQLRRSGSRLAVQTYELYKTVVDAEPSDLPELVKRGESYFYVRRSDSFFIGGDQTEGGGDDNAVTVDYRLASLLKRARYDAASGIHSWRW